MDTIRKQDGFLTGELLKYLAMVSMLIDHMAAVLLAPLLLENYDAVLWGFSVSALYDGMRDFGRLAFPIYCFLLVEGFFHTSNRKKMLGNLLLFALLSEIPFDLAFQKETLELGYQNVFVTLSLGYLGLVATYEKGLHPLVRFLGVLGFGYLSFISRADYDLYGYVAILIFGLVYPYSKIYRIPATCLAFYFEGLPAMVAALPIYLYNGERGKMRLPKYFFYCFYPVHLALLYLLSFWIYGPLA